MSAIYAAVTAFSVGVVAMMRHMCEVMGAAQAEQPLASAKPTEARRLQKAKRHTATSTTAVRRGRRFARDVQSTADYVAGPFS